MINLRPIEKEVLKPKLTVVSAGGAGGNAINNMILNKLDGATFIATNTDAQALESSLADYKIQLGLELTKGLGAGATPEIGAAAAQEAEGEIAEYLEGSNMVFITAGMGGGTGTGASPEIARIAKEKGILTVGVVTKPFAFEGKHRMDLALEGIERLQQFVDTLIVIPNQNLFRLANEKTTFADAFKMADNVLHSGVRGVTDLMVMPGLINLDFADIRSVMSEMGKAMMGTGESAGERRSIEAAEAAISNPLLDDISMRGAKGVLINITGGSDMTLYEVDEAANRIREEVDEDANIIFGSTFNDELEGLMRVSVVATGIDEELRKNKEQKIVKKPVQVQKQAPAQNIGRIPVVVPKKTTPPATNTNYFSSQPQQNNTVKPVAPQPVSQPVNHYNPSAKKQQSGFFNKITSGAFGFSKEEGQLERGYEPKVSPNNYEQPRENNPQQQQMHFGGAEQVASKTVEQKKEKVMAGDDDYFEIPAFLRNNKND